MRHWNVDKGEGMATSIKDRLRALETQRPLDVMPGVIAQAEFAASVFRSFIEDRSDPAQAMVRHGIDEANARRFSRMGFKAAQREVMASLHDAVEAAK